MMNKRFLNFSLWKSPSLLTLTLIILGSILQQSISAQTVNTLIFPADGKIAQTQQLPPNVFRSTPQDNRVIEIAQPQIPGDIFRRPEQDNRPLAPTQPPVLPPPEKLIPSPIPAPSLPEQVPNEFPGTITVSQFEVVGSSVFSPKQLAKETEEFTNKEISFAELLRASEKISQLYRDKGYVTSGAFIPGDQTFKSEGSVVKIQVVEGSLEKIQVRGLRRLNSGYVRSRLKIATGKPLNINKLVQALQLLQLNPLIQNISAELTAGSSPGTSVLDVKVAEAKTFFAQLNLDNNRIPSIGSFQRQIQLREASLLGLGDDLTIAYANTDGSNDVDVSYKLPINARNGTLEFSYNYTDSKIVEKPFDILDIEGTSRDYSLTLRQPLVQTPTEEFAVGLTATRRESDVNFLRTLNSGERVPFPEPGADKNGNTRLSVLRFFQEWTKRDSRQVLAARSLFSVGIDAFDATTQSKSPDGRFFSWRGQAQWARLLAADTLLLIRADAQIADRALVPLEQFGLGGQRTVRGYRQDLLLTDNAFLASLELRYPIVRLPNNGGVLQVTPFVDVGTAWNSSGMANPDTSTLASTGLGLLWQSKNISARFDWGIPLVSVTSRGNTLQEDGLYFSVIYTQPF